jgi:hypothetical protein
MMADEQPRKRRRAIRACVPCRQMKKKCDGIHPCSHCSRFQHHCEYRQRKEASPDEAGPGVRLSLHNTTLREPPPNEATTSTESPRNGEDVDLSVLDPEKGRYFDASSAIAFPRLVGLQHGADKAPRLHSFAWNLGIRQEPLPNTFDVTQMVTLDAVHVYSNAYFMKIHPAFEFLDRQEFIRRASLRWKGSLTEDALNFDAVICGVLGLGYFVSQKTDDGIEAALIKFAKDQLESVALVRPPTVDLIAACILRALYLRATSRPHASWMASNIVMHLIEAAGLQRDLSLVAPVDPSTNSSPSSNLQTLYGRKVFWVGRAINAIFSYEYSRPRIIIHKINCARVDTDVSKSTRDLLQLAELVPEISQSCDESTYIAHSVSMLDSLKAFTSAEVPISLFCADLAFAAYRHLRLTRNFVTSGNSSADLAISHLLSIGTVALKAINDHLNDLSPPHSLHSPDRPAVTPWWSLVSVPFHFTLIALSLDTEQSLGHVSCTLRVLQAVVAVFDTHLTREAVQNAVTLVRFAQHRKERDISALSGALDGIPGISQPSMSDLGASGGGGVVEMNQIASDGSNIASTQQQPTGTTAVGNLNFEPNSMDMWSGNLNGLMIPDSMSFDWDALFEYPYRL